MNEKLLRYCLASVGPIGSAGAQFALSLVLLHRLDTADFGRFSFLVVILQLSWGVWGALFCAPLPALLAVRPAADRPSTLGCLMGANAAGSVIAFAAFLLVAFLVGVDAWAAITIAAYGSLSLMRWYARAQSYAVGELWRPVLSDSIYAGALLIGTALMALSGSSNVLDAFALFLGSTALAMVPFGAHYLSQQFVRNPLRSLGGYAAIWRQHARWSLVGVITTEATANAHVYIVTLAFGPGAYAPLAASGLLIRPVQVAMNALSEFERAQMARHIGANRIDLARTAVRFFRAALIAIWILTGICLAAILLFAPHLVFPAQYEMQTLIVGSALWMAVAAIRLLRTPDSVLLQAGGAFQPLASASVLSAFGSIAGVTALLLVYGPLWSIAGILLGEVMFAWRIWHQLTLWQKSMAVT